MSLPPSLPLTDKAVVVTGGASGIGRACAELLIERGAKVAIWDLAADTLDVAERLGAHGQVVDVTADLAGPVAVAVEARGSVAGLVPAGVAVRGFSVIAPSLEDLFVSLTGEGFDVSG